MTKAANPVDEASQQAANLIRNTDAGWSVIKPDDVDKECSRYRIEVDDKTIYKVPLEIHSDCYTAAMKHTNMAEAFVKLISSMFVEKAYTFASPLAPPPRDAYEAKADELREMASSLNQKILETMQAGLDVHLTIHEQPMISNAEPTPIIGIKVSKPL